MRKRNHISWTLAISFWLYFYIFKYDLKYTIILAIITATISFIPDIDLTLLNYIKKIEKATIYLSWPITALAKTALTHRKLTHTIYLPTLLFIASEIIGVQNPYLTAIFRIFYLAIYLHILEDMFTIQGIDFLYPLPPHIKLWNFSTKSYITTLFLDLIGYSATILLIYWAHLSL